MKFLILKATIRKLKTCRLFHCYVPEIIKRVKAKEKREFENFLNSKSYFLEQICFNQQEKVRFLSKGFTLKVRDFWVPLR